MGRTAMHIRLQVLLGPFLLGASAMAPSREITELHRTVAKLRKQLADCQAATKSRDGGMAVDAVRDGMAVTAGARLQVRQAPEQEQAHSLQESMAKKVAVATPLCPHVNTSSSSSSADCSPTESDVPEVQNGRRLYQTRFQRERARKRALRKAASTAAAEEARSVRQGSRDEEVAVPCGKKVIMSGHNMPAPVVLYGEDGRELERCSVRFQNVEEAWSACLQRTSCLGVVKDNGISCGGSHRQYELRASVPRPEKGPLAFVCSERVEARRAMQQQHSLDQRKGLNLSAGFLFIVLGACDKPAMSCSHLVDLENSVRLLRAHGMGYPIAVLSDGGVDDVWFRKHVAVDLIEHVSEEDGGAGLTLPDPRGRKLLAYSQSPFLKTVYLDADTAVLSKEVKSLFSALDRFDLAASFECCRTVWSESKTPYDRGGFMYGWEMQTGVMAYAKNQRTAKFWAEARHWYNSQAQYWASRSSAEQGAATYALASSEVRYVPLPPSFNVRPYTLYQWLYVFKFVVYHGKDMWGVGGVNGAKDEGALRRLLGQRLLRDWGQVTNLIRKEFHL